MSKILVIDDRHRNLTSVRATLEDAIPDCLVIDAHSGKEGIELAGQKQPDVILLDVLMPEMDGYEVCKRLKTNDKTRHIHVILISAYETGTKNKVKGFSAGADAFLIRPIEKAELAAQITSMLRISHTEQQLKEALTKAEEAERLKSAFLATMSHEFRTPLNAIIGFSALLNEETPAIEMAAYGKTIHDNGHILLKLVEDLFDITLIETGDIKLKHEAVNIHSIVNEALEVAGQEKIMERKKHLAVKFNPGHAASELPLYSDQSRLKQILVNLIKNAVKFTANGMVEIGYKKEAWTGKQYVTFYVKDTGIGIAREHYDLIFEPFRQVDDTYSRPFQGAGVGLFISKKLAALLGGELWVESVPGNGSTFFLTLPLTSGPESKGSSQEDLSYSRRKIS
ncbi:MAG: response regulator [Bacteroidales bacterium]|nr:response regulator [Bacteroidales bacterium]